MIFRKKNYYTPQGVEVEVVLLWLGFNPNM
jgi:hypothetical protein